MSVLRVICSADDILSSKDHVAKAAALSSWKLCACRSAHVEVRTRIFKIMLANTLLALLPLSS